MYYTALHMCADAQCYLWYIDWLSNFCGLATVTVHVHNKQLGLKPIGLQGRWSSQLRLHKLLSTSRLIMLTHATANLHVPTVDHLS